MVRIPNKHLFIGSEELKMFMSMIRTDRKKWTRAQQLFWKKALKQRKDDVEIFGEK